MLSSSLENDRGSTGYKKREIIFVCFLLGVTDSKAVKGSKSVLDWSDASSPSSIVVIVTGIAAGLIFTVLLVCLFVTCRRKVSVFPMHFSLKVKRINSHYPNPKTFLIYEPCHSCFSFCTFINCLCFFLSLQTNAFLNNSVCLAKVNWI